MSTCEPHTAEPKLLALVRARFLWHFPYLERTQGVRMKGVPRAQGVLLSLGPPGPLELAALGPAVVSQSMTLK